MYFFLKQDTFDKLLQNGIRLLCHLDHTFYRVYCYHYFLYLPVIVLSLQDKSLNFASSFLFLLNNNSNLAHKTMHGY